MEIKKIVLPEGWKFDKVNGNEIILKEAKEELPKTWEECFEKLGKGEFIDPDSNIAKFPELGYPDNEDKNIVPYGFAGPILALMQLLVCREVYRQGWKPNWNDDSEDKYCILYYNDKIDKKVYNHTSRILSFQSAEICNEFLENFRDLIEEAKELL